MKRPGMVAGLLLVVAFGLGALTGVAVDRWTGSSPQTQVRITRDYSSLLNALKLAPEQRAKVRELMEQSAPASEAILRAASEGLRRVSDSIAGRLRELIPADQHPTLEQYLKKPIFLMRR